jgi:D-amino-acid dehydrogenase
MKVCVVGAGIVGCSTAYQLARLGCEVELIDEAARPGMVSSHANGAQLSYSYVEPLASPATLASLPGMLLSRNSPLRFVPQLDWRQWYWGLQFLAACTTRQVQAGTQTLLQLSQLSRDTLMDWMAQEGWAVDYQQSGKLVLCPSEASLQRQRRQVQFQRALGCEQELLGVQACVEREPALAAYAGRFAGGVWTADERVADPYRLCLELVGSARRLGATVALGTQLRGFDVHAGRVRAVHTSRGTLQADAFVLATGSQVARHAAQLGIYLPVYPIKGYSLTLPLQDERKAPRVSVTDLSMKTVFAPLGGRLRVAAMAEVAGYGLSIPPRRVAQMLASVDTLFPGACDMSHPERWAGLRPATPRSLPIIGRRKYANLYLNAGHGALGLTLAAGSAVALSEEILAAAKA